MITVPLRFVAVILTMKVFSNAYPSARNPNTGNEICLTPACVKEAEEISYKMNMSVDPCDNFYNFACGGFEEAYDDMNGDAETSMFSLTQNKLYNQLRRILGEPIRNGELKIFKNMKNLYVSCMDRDKIEELGLSVMKDTIVQLGGWPVLQDGNWNEAMFDWKRLMYAFRQMGFNTAHYITLAVSADVGDNSKRIIYIQPPALSLDKDFIFADKTGNIVNAYGEYMVNLAVLFGANRRHASKEMDKIVDFEIELALNTLTQTQTRNITLVYNKFTIRQLQEKFPFIPWLEYIRSILSTGEKLYPDEIVIVTQPEYVEALGKIMKKTPRSTQANYSMVKILMQSATFLTEEVMKVSLKFKRVVHGSTKSPSRRKECVDSVSNAMNNVLGSLYVRKYFDKESKSEILNMMKYIRRAFEEMLKANDWMDARTKQKAIDKLHAMVQHIAYPDELLDDKLLSEVYGQIQIIHGQYYKSMLNVAHFMYDLEYKRLREPVNKTEWISHGATAVVDAFHRYVENAIIFPAGILQGHFFNRHRPRYVNFGAFGALVGHEITHGFDILGHQFDKDGNLNDWWDPETKASFLEKANCMVDQYSQSIFPKLNMKINGNRTQGENIADNGGIAESYFAYQTWKGQNRAEPQLPGLNFSSNQMFWLSLAQAWCYRSTPEMKKYIIAADNHSPQECRVLVPLSNLKEFSADFGCPLGSAMNPHKKCKVW